MHQAFCLLHHELCLPSHLIILNELRRDVSSALVQRQWDWDTLDFGEIEKQLAAKLTDDDIKNVLVRIDAVNRVTRLRLTNCVNITGTGLQPISGSTTIEDIDLSLVRDNRSPVLDPEPTLSVEQVLPILNSIISSRGNAVRLFQFPWVWRKGQGVTSESESDFDRFLAKCNENWRNRSCSCLNCNTRLNLFCNDDGIWYGSQCHTCHQCLKKCCYEEDCKDENGENYSLALGSCRMCLKDFCKECARMNYCAACQEYYCERCVSVSQCADCNRSLCNATCRMNECKEGNNNCRGCIQLIAPDLLEKSKTLLEARLELKACVLKIQGVCDEVVEKQQSLIESSKAHLTDIYERNMKQIGLQDDLIQKSNDQFKECLKVAEAEYGKRLRCLEAYLGHIISILIITVILLCCDAFWAIRLYLLSSSGDTRDQVDII